MRKTSLIMLYAITTLVIAVATLAWQPSEEATILFAGDAMAHQAQLDAAKQPDGSYDFSACYEYITPIIQNADFAIVNLETPLGGAPYSGYPCFCAPDSYASALQEAGFDLFLTANNHALDRRDKGAKRTIDTLDEMGIPHIGTYKSQEARDSLMPMIMTINGFKVGMLNYTYGTNGIPAQKDVVVDLIDRELITNDIKNLRDNGAELIMASIHWGIEYKLLPNSTQKSLAEFLVEQGVEMVFGGHPHVIQPIELHTETPTGKPALIIYSLGNFISNMKTRDTRGGAIVEATLKRDDEGNAYIADASYRLIFVEPGIPGKSNFTLYPAEKLTDGQWVGHRRAFENSAVRIFDKHNINVKRDTTTILR